MTARIPVVDFSEGVTPEFIEHFGKGLMEYGFVSLVGHGVNETLLKDLYVSSKEVFDLPGEIKKAYETKDNGRQTGYTSFRIEQAKDAEHPDLKEFWHVNRGDVPGIPNIFPKEVPLFKPLCLSLFAKMDWLSLKLMGAIGAYLGRPEGFFEKWMVNGNSLLRVLNYPELGSGIEDSAHVGLRSAPHEDINFITILAWAQGPGLEILTPDGVWIPVNNPPESLIINSADMLHLHTMFHPSDLSNPGFKVMPSTTHRVVNFRERRLSLPFFVHPNEHAPLVTAGDYLMRRLKEIGLFKK